MLVLLYTSFSCCQPYQIGNLKKINMQAHVRHTFSKELETAETSAIALQKLKHKGWFNHATLVTMQ